MSKLSAVYLLVLSSPIFAYAATPTVDEFNTAARANDLVKLRALVMEPGAITLRDHVDATPLHYAAIYGSVDAVKILVNAGADPNAANRAGVTPVILGAYNFERTQLMVEKGGNVNAHTKRGISPLMVAASAQNNAATVRYLLEKGADAKWTADGDNALYRACGQGDTESVALLLSKGADPNSVSGSTPLMNALTYKDSERVRLLLKAGANVNAVDPGGLKVRQGPLALAQLTALMIAAPAGPLASVDALLRAGAKVNAADIRKMTPLMFAVATDFADPAIVHRLIEAGADVNAKDQNGESVLDWAHKFRRPEITNLLTAAGAIGAGEPIPTPIRAVSTTPTPTPAEAVARASSLLSHAVPVVFEKGGCAACHAQGTAGRAFAAARKAGLSPDQALWNQFTDGILADRALATKVLPMMTGLGGDYDRYLFSLLAMADNAHPADRDTDLYVQYVAARQDSSGAWSLNGLSRPPMQDSTIARTSMALRVIKSFGWPGRQADFDRSIQRAAAWLLAAKPATSLEEADRLVALHAAGVSNQALSDSLQNLLKQQHEDGGWAQTPWLDSDAYATGLVLYNLYNAGMLTPGSEPYRRGAAFLLATQYPDGSWYVRSRSPKFQPYFQTGFPFDHDQWISEAGTAYAAMALSPAASAQLARR